MNMERRITQHEREFIEENSVREDFEREMQKPSLCKKSYGVDYCRDCSKHEDCDYKNRRTVDEKTCIDFERR